MNRHDEKTAPRNIVKVTSYKPFIAMDEDSDLLLDEEALSSESYLLISTEDAAVTKYVNVLEDRERVRLLDVHYRFSGTPTSSTILSVYMPQLLAYCLKGVLITSYYEEKRRDPMSPLLKRIMDVLKKYVAARIIMDDDLRLHGQSTRVNRGFVYTKAKIIPIAFSPGRPAS